MNYNHDERIKLVGLGAEEISCIKSAGEILKPHFHAIVEEFYERMSQHEELRQIISVHTTTDRLKHTFRKYLEQLFSGTYGGEYDNHRIQIGLTHDRVGLPLMWYLGMFGHMQSIIYEHLAHFYEHKSVKEWRILERAIASLMKYDQLLAVDAYVDSFTNQLRQESLASQNARKAKSVFLATVSHELRTPLSSILGFTDLILDTSSEISPQTRQHLQVLHRNAQSLLGLIDGVIEIGYADSGKWKTSPTRQTIKSLLDDMSISAEGLIVGRPIKIKRLYLDKASPEVTADFTKIRQIVLNLVSNACKFTDSGTVSLDFVQTPSHATIVISDTGPGIPNTEHENIFKEFTRLKSGGSKKPGSGLGLSLVRTLVESLHGSIDIGSVTPNGSIFSVTLPIYSPSDC